MEFVSLRGFFALHQSSDFRTLAQRLRHPALVTMASGYARARIIDPRCGVSSWTAPHRNNPNRAFELRQASVPDAYRVQRVSISVSWPPYENIRPSSWQRQHRIQHRFLMLTAHISHKQEESTYFVSVAFSNADKISYWFWKDIRVNPMESFMDPIQTGARHRGAKSVLLNSDRSKLFLLSL